MSGDSVGGGLRAAEAGDGEACGDRRGSGRRQRRAVIQDAVKFVRTSAAHYHQWPNIVS